MVDFERLHNIIENLEEKRINQLMDKIDKNEQVEYEEMIMMKNYYDTHKPHKLEV